MSVAPLLRVALVGLNAPGYRSLGLAYVRAFAEADARLRDVAFETIDLDTGIDPWWVALRVLERRPDVVGLSLTCFNARPALEVARIVKTARPELLVVIGGPEAGPRPEELLEADTTVDVVVRGEGEKTFADVVHARLRGSDIAAVPGASSRVGERVASAPDRPLVEDLDELPSPYLSGVLAPVEGSTYLESYRGCPHRCGYCFEGKGTGRVRTFSFERIAAELDFITSSGVRSFSFIDPVFNLTPARLEKMADLLAPHAARGARLHTIEVDIERIGDAEAAWLASAGVASVETGPQSVGERALAACRRGFDAERFAQGVRACRSRGISVECDLIVGLPGDEPDDVVDGLEFAIGLDPGVVQVSTLHVLPGTDLWARAEELGLRYDPVPPHEIVSTPTIGFSDLRRLEALGVAATTLDRARLGRPPGSGHEGSAP